MVTISRFSIPTYAATVIDRPRLYERLDAWQAVRALAIHAPAGYGKSSLVSRWLDLRGLTANTAWMALDEDDNDPRFFVQHLATAITRLLRDAMALIQPILQAGPDTAARALQQLCAALDAATTATGQPALLVLDDLHFITTPAVHALLATCLEHGPPLVHYILLARRRAGTPLARLVAHGKVVTLDADDLRFTPAEVAAYLERQGFQPPTPTELKELTRRCEGWITALQLGVLALRRRVTVQDLIGELHGSDAWLADFLTDEVLNRQPPALRDFLLQTAMLDAFDADLCAAVTGMEDAYGKLAAIVRADLFLIPLDGRGWYRYHHLFQELLQHRLQAQAPPGFVAELHHRAATWLAAHHQVSAAIRHLLAAGAGEQAAALVETDLCATLLHDPYRAQTLLALLPPTVIAQRPQLLLDRCRVAALFGDRQLGSHLQEVQAALQTLPPDDLNASRYQGEWLVLRSGYAYLQHDLAGAAAFVEQVQAYWPHLDNFHAGTIHFVQMHLHSAAGKHTAMEQAAEAALAAYEQSGWSAGIVALRRELARKSMFSGNSAEATRWFQALVAGINENAPLVTNELVFAYHLAAENSYWLDQVEQARVYQQACLELATRLQDQELIALARSLGGALTPDPEVISTDPLAIANDCRQIKSSAVVDFVLDCKSRSLIALGRSDLAWQVVTGTDVDLPGWLEGAAFRRLIPYLRAYVARGVDLAAITPVLVDALAKARAGQDRFNELHLLGLTAWQQLQLLELKATRATVAEAVKLAQETGYVRVLLDLPALAPLLAGRGLTPAQAPTKPATSPRDGAGALTEQELAVLRLLAAEHTYEEIAAACVVSINTVRTHVRHIYKKLGVRRRDQAITAARQRGWLAG